MPPAGLYRARGLAHEAALRIGTAADQRPVWQALLDLGALWAGRDYDRSGDYFHAKLALTSRTQVAAWALARDRTSPR